MRHCKIVVFVPVSGGDRVRQAMGDAGAGVIGNYSYCSFTVRGIGRFRPDAGASPSVGEVGRLEAVEEERIETVCEAAKLGDIIAAIRVRIPTKSPRSMSIRSRRPKQLRSPGERSDTRDDHLRLRESPMSLR